LGLFVDIDVLETQEQQFYSDKVWPVFLFLALCCRVAHTTRQTFGYTMPAFVLGSTSRYTHQRRNTALVYWARGSRQRHARHFPINLQLHFSYGFLLALFGIATVKHSRLIDLDEVTMFVELGNRSFNMALSKDKLILWPDFCILLTYILRRWLTLPGVIMFTCLIIVYTFALPLPTVNTSNTPVLVNNWSIALSTSYWAYTIFSSSNV
jgi:hypothetical protein